jgi:hypothetical protein
MSEQTGTSLTVTIQGPSLMCNEGYSAGFAYCFSHGRCNAASTGLCFSAAYTAFSRSSLTGTTSKNCQVLTVMSAVSHYILNSAAFMSSSLKKTQVQLTSIYFTPAAIAGQTQDSPGPTASTEQWKGNRERRMKLLYPNLVSNRTISVPESSLLCDVASQARNEDPT